MGGEARKAAEGGPRNPVAGKATSVTVGMNLQDGTSARITTHDVGVSACAATTPWMSGEGDGAISHGQLAVSGAGASAGSAEPPAQQETAGSGSAQHGIPHSALK